MCNDNGGRNRFCNPKRVSDEVCDYAECYEYVVDVSLVYLCFMASITRSHNEVEVTGYFCQGQRSPKRGEEANPYRETDESLVTT